MDDPISLAEARNNVRIQGQGGRAMMFAHGFGCDQNMWRFVAPAIEDAFRTVLFGHVGAGGSDLAADGKIRLPRPKARQRNSQLIAEVAQQIEQLVLPRDRCGQQVVQLVDHQHAAFDTAQEVQRCAFPVRPSRTQPTGDAKSGENGGIDCC